MYKTPFKLALTALLFLTSTHGFALYLQTTAINPINQSSATIHMDYNAKDDHGFLRIHVFNRDTNKDSIINFSNPASASILSQLHGVKTPSGSLHSAITLEWWCFVGLYHPDCLNRNVDGTSKSHNYESLFLANQQGYCEEVPDFNATSTIIASINEMELRCRTTNSGKNIILKSNVTVRGYCVSSNPYEGSTSGAFGDNEGEFTISNNSLPSNLSISCVVGNNVSLEPNSSHHYNTRYARIIFSPLRKYAILNHVVSGGIYEKTGRMVFVRR